MTRRAASKIIIFLALALLTTFGRPSAAQADGRARLEDPFEITADRIDYDGARDLYVATGHVHVVQEGRSLSANWVAFSTGTRIGVAEETSCWSKAATAWMRPSWSSTSTP